MNDDALRFRTYIQTVGRGERRAKALGIDEAADAMGLILDGRADPEQRGAFLLACRIRGEDPAEMAGFVRALQSRCTPLPLPSAARHVLTVGHPYDGREDTFIMGAGAALIAAAAGATIIFHGGGRVPAKHAPGVADLFAALGVPEHCGPENAATFLAAHGFVHLDTRRFLPAWSGQLEIREKIGLRLPFSSAEKLLDPAGCGNVMLGIAHGPYLLRMTGAMQHLGIRRGTVVQGLEGSCDLSPQHPARVAVVAGDEVREESVDPRALGVFPTEVRTLGADPVLGARLTREAFEGTNAPAAEALAFNGAVLLWRAGVCETVAAGLDRARQLIASGAALERLEAARKPMPG